MKIIIAGLAIAFVVLIGIAVCYHPPGGDSGKLPQDNTSTTDVSDNYVWVRRAK